VGTQKVETADKKKEDAAAQNLLGKTCIFLHEYKTENKRKEIWKEGVVAKFQQDKFTVTDKECTCKYSMSQLLKAISDYEGNRFKDGQIEFDSQLKRQKKIGSVCYAVLYTMLHCMACCLSAILYCVLCCTDRYAVLFAMLYCRLYCMYCMVCCTV
jgi:hypothetical protein